MDPNTKFYSPYYTYTLKFCDICLIHCLKRLLNECYIVATS